MKWETWIDRTFGALWSILVARLLGPALLGSWTAMIALAWALSPWPASAFRTRVMMAVASFVAMWSLTLFWPWAHERQTLLLLTTAGLAAYRLLHAVPAEWHWRGLCSIASLAVGGIVLLFSKSLTAALAAAAGVALLSVLLLLDRSALKGPLEIPQPAAWGRLLLTGGVQMQIVAWVYSVDPTRQALGHIAAALFVLEIFKIGVVGLLHRYDDALVRLAVTRESFLEGVRTLFSHGLLIMPPCVLGLLAGSSYFVQALYGEAFAPTAGYLAILTWGFAFSFFSLLTARVLVLRERGKVIVWAQLAHIGVEWLGAAWAVPRFGAEGACFARVAGDITGFLIMWPALHAEVPGLLRPFRRHVG